MPLHTLNQRKRSPTVTQQREGTAIVDQCDSHGPKVTLMLSKEMSPLLPSAPFVASNMTSEIPAVTFTAAACHT